LELIIFDDDSESVEIYVFMFKDLWKKAKEQKK